MKNYLQKLARGWAQQLLVVVGLDTDPNKIPAFFLKKYNGDKLIAMFEYNKAIVEKTKDLVLGYKVNIAFYELYGALGIEVFEKTCKYLSEQGLFVIADIKRGDIGNTNVGYTKYLQYCDAITISGYFGEDANEPFLAEEFKDRLIIVLAKTSNKGSKEIQDLVANGIPVYLHMAKNVMHWGKNKNCAIVVGATHPNHLMQARYVIGQDGIILAPGVGAQGASLKSVIECGANPDGTGIIINASRSVIFASDGEDFADAARAEVIKMNTEAKEYLSLPRILWEDVRQSTYQQRTFDILAMESAVLRNDHFVYQAGDHGDTYIAKDKVTPNPLAIDEMASMLADLIQEYDIETVVAPALGSIVLGHSVARYLSYFKGHVVNSVFIEKTGEKDGAGKDTFKITRGYEKYIIGKKCLVIEDILNSGGSAKSVAICVKNAGGIVIMAGAICNRGNVQASDIADNISLISLSSVTLDKYKASECPLCANNVPVNTEFGHGKKFLEEKGS